ncbi:sulfatase [Pelagicoccus enzymogenes]|uniref:sulfatase n=1 Tax=Pelagicoccus enzymogenes TaxID=2773457 RepID=UPI00280EF135|nr:sulfatase [Pelagicoccus enzymogenes]MDQ8198008.1 sulfatase [Pelagicoccus enzymogenes]
MSKRRSLITLAAILATSILNSATHAEQKRPNVVLIVADDLGWKDLSVQGSTFYESPNLDRLANSGARFTNGYASCQVCSPSRASLMTGQSPVRLGITDWIGAPEEDEWKRNTAMLPPTYKHELPHERTTIAEAMKEAGYATFFAGKWHLGDRESDWPEHHGFDINKGGFDRGGPPGGYFSPYQNPRLEDGPDGEYLPLRLGRETAQFIEENADQPFFATLCFYSVHGPAQTTEALWSKYRDKAEKQPQPTHRMGAEARNPIRIVQDNPIYGGMIEAMDQAVGIVMEALEKNGLSENTIVVFTSDNGGVASGDHWATSALPLRGGKGYQWEGGIRVPYFISWPGNIPAGSVSDLPAIGMDVYPTILDLAGLPARPKEHRDGISLAPALKGEKTPARPLYWHYPHYGNQGGDPVSIIREGQWKLLFFHETENSQLYRLDEDPGERSDLSAMYPEHAQQLERKLLAWLDEMEAKMPFPNKNFDEERFQQAQKRIPGPAKERQEKAAAQILDENWKPNPSWWGSQP